MDDLPSVIGRLLDPNSQENTRLREQMEEHYPADGRNSERVANIIKVALQK
jgi:hypothetical protein